MTDLSPIFRKVVLGAAESTLDVAGGALLPGAWPILKGALQPILDRLKERLGGEDVTATPERAREAVKAFEADAHLQEMLRSNLLSRLDSVLASQARIDSDVQKLMMIASGDRKLLDELVIGVEDLGRKLDEGVNLSDAAIERLKDAVLQEAENNRRVRALALRELGPVGDLLKRQLGRLQVRAVELIDDGEIDRAVDELREGLMLVAVLLNEAPTDLNLRLQLGFLYKTMAQVFDAVDDAEQAKAFIDRAEEVFLFIKDDVAGDEKTALELADAIHGLGNVEHGRGHYRAAIDRYQLATALCPDHMYAWHDLFAAYHELSKQGEVHLGEMRHALERLKQTGQGAPGLGAQHIRQLEAALAALEGPPQSEP